ncbi:putative Gly-X carboxypeptidase [Naematelia encephala]|uniref:Putative Gly-X carboxypeptidase n=1 Tax=Naematelia encephala TaxID=71784 RepID=A0A1Y2BHH3_9TREE|nr:putative Gly-X carboxypeptidase [Naematelia encephala]
MSSSEKGSLPLPASEPTRSARSSRATWALFSILILLAYHSNIFSPFSSSKPTHHYTAAQLESAKCPIQPAPLNVGNDWNPLTDPTYAELAAKRLSKSVQLDTESFDNFPLDPKDSVYDKHYKLSHWLESEYSKLFSDPIKHEYVNTHGHLFTWQGSKPELKPILLMAHTDTVPVLAATLDQWTFPPFDGTIAVNATPNTPGTWVWGRGVSDCKNSLLGIYGAVERLVSEGFTPERTILISNGFDEEIGGIRGSGHTAALIAERYGPDGVAFLVDEGFSGISTEYGTTFASFGMAEKGSVNFQLKVETLGGHSSVPPPHTGIGITSLLLAELEAHPFEPVLDPAGPYLKFLSCLSDYADIPSKLKSDIHTPQKWSKLAKELATADRRVNSLLATSQAIDLINGGVKVNALPEVVDTTINYRISFTSSVAETKEHVAAVIKPLASALNFTSTIFGEESASTKSPSHITLQLQSAVSLEPAPITSSTGPSFELMAGTAKHVFGAETIVAPTGMYANTDTRLFWNHTKNLYRFTPAVVVENLNQHTVDERISLDGHLNTTRFFYKLLQNSQGWDDA